MSNIVRYGSYDMDAAEEEAQDLAKSDGAAFLKLKPGRNVVRFLPPPVDVRSPFRTIHQHFVSMPGQAKPVVFACPRVLAKETCPVCLKAEELNRTGSKSDRDRAYQLFPKRRIFANVIDRNDPEAGVQILGFGKMIHDGLVVIRRDPDSGGDFTHPMTGFDIIIERKGTGRTDTEYKVMPARKESKLGDMTWLDQQHDLSRFAKLMTAEQILQALGGNEDEDEEGKSAEDELWQPAPPSRVRGRAAVDDDIPL